jgi:hypothetical protein
MKASCSTGWCGRAAVFASLLAAAGGVRAQQPPAQATTFATLPAPTGILVGPEGEVVVVSDPPTGTTIVSFGPDGTRMGETPVESTPPDRYARSRLARIERGPFLGAAQLTGAGILRVELEAVEDAFEFDLATASGLEALDLDAGGEPAQLSLAGARFDDVAVAPGLVTGQRPGTQPTFDVFVTGATAPGAGARPFLLRVRVEPPGTATVGAMVTTQGTVADPEHRSGVGTFILPSDAPAPERPIAVFAALPTRASAATPRALDTLIVVGAGWPEDTTAVAPTIVTVEGTPVAFTSQGMTNDQVGTLYAVVASDACAPDGGPGVVSLRTVDADIVDACAPLPPAAGENGRYVDVAAGDLGEPVYVTNERGGTVLRLPGLPEAGGQAPARSAIGNAAHGIGR